VLPLVGPSLPRKILTPSAMTTHHDPLKGALWRVHDVSRPRPLLLHAGTESFPGPARQACLPTPLFSSRHRYFALVHHGERPANGGRSGWWRMATRQIAIVRAQSNQEKFRRYAASPCEWASPAVTPARRAGTAANIVHPAQGRATEVQDARLARDIATYADGPKPRQFIARQHRR